MYITLNTDTTRGLFEVCVKINDDSNESHSNRIYYLVDYYKDLRKKESFDILKTDTVLYVKPGFDFEVNKRIFGPYEWVPAISCKEVAIETNKQAIGLLLKK